MKSFILNYAPIWLQNFLISLYNSYLIRLRRGGVYAEKKEFYSEFGLFSNKDAVGQQSELLNDFLSFVVKKSRWYGAFSSTDKLSNFPVLEKSELVKNLALISTIQERDAIVSLTGGTTGASMKVLYTKSDNQERHAILDLFREYHGYTLGNRVAWFSGKGLVNKSDLSKGICYRDDWFNNIRFFSTFHICSDNFEFYWSSFICFSPEFLVGFPSSVYDLCLLAKQRGLIYPSRVNAFFPTAETVLPMHRAVISEVLGCKIFDQYASSEGAPFILECEYATKHIHPLSGVFEVVDESGNSSQEGEILITSFTTHGTPLVRYRIGDRVKLSSPDYQCPCGSTFQCVESIEGRSNDFVFSRQNGKVNLGNISNSTKDVAGIICFQIVQSDVTSLHVSVVSTPEFTSSEEAKFLAALKLRVGDEMKIYCSRVESIPRESSGKFRVVKNMLSSDQLSA